MAVTIEKIIARSITIAGYHYPAAYDSTHEVSYGYWVCQACKSSFFYDQERNPHTSCSLKERVQGPWIDRGTLYVLGPNENGAFSPFKDLDIEKIKGLAKSKL